MINVISTDETGSVCENKLFTGKNASGDSEKYFIKKMKELHKEVQKDEIDISLDDGLYSYNGCSVFLSHPEIVK